MKVLYESRDKMICPFLLIHQEVNFFGTKLVGSIVYFQFSPLNTCEKLVNEFVSGKASPVPPKKLLDAVETYRDLVFQTKGER